MLLRFAGVGILNTVFGLACIFAAMAVLGLHPIAANVVGYVAGFVLGYVLNRLWTFGDRSPVRRTAPRYAAVVLAGYGNSLAVLAAVLETGLDPYAAQILSAAVYSSLVFLGARHYAFRPD